MAIAGACGALTDEGMDGAKISGLSCCVGFVARLGAAVVSNPASKVPLTELCIMRSEAYAHLAWRVGLFAQLPQAGIN
jgi:hypothetical protein